MTIVRGFIRFYQGPLRNGDYFEFPEDGIGPPEYFDNCNIPSRYWDDIYDLRKSPFKG